jgi:UDP-N-acetylglucosamine/UDP-N-acetylgalactosamine diphosphorylase
VTLPSKDELLARVRPIGQEHLLAFWDELSPCEQATLAEQIGDIDPQLFTRLRDERTASPEEQRSEWAALAAQAKAPDAVRLGHDDSFIPHARETGAAAIARGEVGMILVAGGLGTRLGFDQPKGIFRLGPLSQRSLFQILIERLRAVSRRFGGTIPLYVMTSPATDAVTREFLAANRNFGLRDDELRIFRQATMWAVDEHFERILLASRGSLFLGPDGHGGMLAALVRSGSLEDARRRGIRHFFYGQIDNPLLQVCDPLLVGGHINAGSQMTTQVVRKRDPLERVGNVVANGSKTQVIEYSDLPAEIARQTNADGSLKLWAGNLAVHLFDTAFLTEMSQRADALPFHRALKKVPCVDSSQQVIEPQQPNAIRFERFIFDLLPWAKQALVIEADPAEAFAPVKNADGEPTDTPTTARRAMIARDTRLLASAGMDVAEGVAVEVNPLWATTAEEVRRKLPPGTRIERPTYFAADGPHEVSSPSPCERGLG